MNAVGTEWIMPGFPRKAWEKNSLVYYHDNRQNSTIPLRLAMDSMLSWFSFR